MKLHQKKRVPARPPWRGAFLAAAAAASFVALPAQAQTDQVFSPVGGDEGSQFVSRCPQDRVLTGFQLTVGDDVDAIRPICIAAYGPAEVGPPEPHPSKFGGPPPDPVVFGQRIPRAPLQDRQLVCPGDTPVITRMYLRAEGVDTIVINNIHLFCGVVSATQGPKAANPTVVHDGPPHPNLYEGGLLFGKEGARVRQGNQDCPPGLVAVGVHGRSGHFLDALGLICGAPRLAARPGPPPVRAQGRVKTGGEPSGPPLSICEAARKARERKSPAAPGLEEKCRASQDASAVKAQGRVKVEASGPPIPTCDAARAARDRNSPAAPGLEAKCLALGGKVPPPATVDAPDPDELAARGETLANENALSAELRYLQPEGPNRRGFDIGIAATEGHTAWGPGKQKTLNSLSPAEQEGFKVASSFSLDRNRNAALADTGAAIAVADPAVEKARTRETDPRYWLGFDIATAIFGDPAQGAQGNTLTGPGSLKIRDSLSAAGQRGFDAAVSFHLARSYRR